MLFDLRLLDNFLEAADTLSFSRAAQRRGMSQPRFSFLIKRLERQLGFDLFKRANRRVSLTAEGEILLERLKALKAATASVDNVVWELRKETRTRLRLGSPRHMVSIPQRNWLVAELCARHPTVSLELDESGTLAVLDRLKAGTLDAALATGPIESEGFELQLIAEGKALVAIPRTDPLALQPDIHVVDLKGRTVVTRGARIGQIYMDAWYGPLKSAGAILTQGPEDHPGSLLDYAARKQATTIVHQWSTESPEATTFPHEFAFRPLIGNEMNMRIYLVRRPKAENIASQWLWDIAAELAQLAHSPAKLGQARGIKEGHFLVETVAQAAAHSG
jgi:DNA-binding transcriptional LysR family regulator